METIKISDLVFFKENDQQFNVSFLYRGKVHLQLSLRLAKWQDSILCFMTCLWRCFIVRQTASEVAEHRCLALFLEEFMCNLWPQQSELEWSRQAEVGFCHRKETFHRVCGKHFFCNADLTMLSKATKSITVDAQGIKKIWCADLK